jgi:SAM-dependent methyltransferase
MTTQGPYEPKAYWTERGRSYKREFHARFERAQREAGGDRNITLLLETLAAEPFGSFLDVGCGYGLYLKAVEGAFPDRERIEGCDISPTQLSEARRFLGPATRVRLTEVDGLVLPYEDDAFDVSFTYGVCIHVPDERIDGFLGEILRVTRSTYLSLESSLPRAARAPQYFAHDYTALFRARGMAPELVAEIDPATNERLLRVRKAR